MSVSLSPSLYLAFVRSFTLVLLYPRLLERADELLDDLVEGLVAAFAEVSVLADLVQQGLLGGLHVLHELLLELGDPGGVQLVEEA